MTVPNRQQTEVDFGVPWALCCPAPGSVSVEAHTGVKLGPSHVHQGLAEAATNCGLLYGSKQVTLGQSQEASDVDQHQSPS